jgi:copper transport protein
VTTHLAVSFSSSGPTLWRRVLLALCAFVALSLAVSPVALAHSVLLRSEPADSTVLTGSPKEVRMWFSEKLEPEFSSARLLDVNGQEVAQTTSRVDAAQQSVLVLSLPALAKGAYSVRWQVFSELDGHVVQGSIVFGVGVAAAVGNSATPSPAGVPALEAVLRWLDFLAIASLTGALAVYYLVLPQARRRLGVAGAGLATVVEHRVLTWSVVGAMTALLVGFALLAWQISLLAANTSRLHVLTATRWGQLWAVRQALLLGLTAVVVALLRSATHRPSRTLPWPGPAGAILLGAAILDHALAGHASAVPSALLLTIAADALHILAVGLWMGGILTLAVAVLPLAVRQRDQAAGLLRAYWSPFSRLAAAGVAIIAVTGVFMTGQQVASADALLATLYGQTLLLKSALLVAAGACGLTNALLLHPIVASPLARLLKKPAGWTPLPVTRLPVIVTIEAGIGLVIFLAAGLLTSLPPAYGPEFAPVPPLALTSSSQMAGDLLVTFSARPNRPGPAIFSVQATTTRRPVPGKIEEVGVRFTSPDGDVIDVAQVSQSADGSYGFGGEYFTSTGPWQVTITAKRQGMPDSVANIAWTVAAPVAARATIISRQPLAPLTTAAAALLALLVMAVVATVVLRNTQRHQHNIGLHDGQAKEHSYE